MSMILKLIGLVIAGYAGFNNLHWYVIFISGFIMMLGWLVTRISVCQNLISLKGLPSFLFIFLPQQTIMYSVITGIVYGAAIFIA